MKGIESEAVRFGHAAARRYGELLQSIAVIRRIEQHRQTLVNWLFRRPDTARDGELGLAGHAY